MARVQQPCEKRVNIHELEKREDRLLHLWDVALRKQYAQRIKGALQEMQFKRQSSQLAEELLTGRRSLKDILNDSDGEWERQIRNACGEYQGLRELTLLLIGSPRSHTELSLEQDRQARQKQLQHFYDILTARRDKEKCIKVTISVQTYSNLLDHLKAFMVNDAAKAKRVFIVFNGHGDDNGHLTFEKDVNNTSTSVFIKDVHKTWKKYRHDQQASDSPAILPEHISVVFAQCYGYKHDMGLEASDIIDVVCLTDANNPQTRSVYRLSTKRHNVKDALHLELTNYARDVVRQESGESSATQSDDNLNIVPVVGEQSVEIGHNGSSKQSLVCNSGGATNANAQRDESSGDSMDPCNVLAQPDEASGDSGVVSNVLAQLPGLVLACQAFTHDESQLRSVGLITKGVRSRDNVRDSDPYINTLSMFVSQVSLSDHDVVGSEERDNATSVARPAATRHTRRHTPQDRSRSSKYRSLPEGSMYERDAASTLSSYIRDVTGACPDTADSTPMSAVTSQLTCTGQASRHRPGQSDGSSPKVKARSTRSLDPAIVSTLNAYVESADAPGQMPSEDGNNCLHEK